MTAHPTVPPSPTCSSLLPASNLKAHPRQTQGFHWHSLTQILLGSSLTGCLLVTTLTVETALVLAQTPAPRTAATSTPRPTLRLGDQGAAVTELQAMLRLLGFYSGAVNGTFSDRTQAAVTAFQRAAGVTADGVVGTATWNRLLPPASGTQAASSAQPPATRPTNPPAQQRPRPATPAPATRPSPATERPTLRLGMEGPPVALLQERLRAKGVYSGNLDGIFGEQTEAAVKAFQARSGLETDGVVGPATWQALFR